MLVVGSGLGELSAALSVQYKEAQVLSLDLSHEMLGAGEAGHRVQADAASLPYKTASMDMIIAHALLPWVETWGPVVSEWRRVLRPEGVLMLSAFGPDTLKECISTVRTPYPVRIDMHDLGDMLIQAGFLEPVIDVANFNIRYQVLSRLQEDLNGMGLPHFTVIDNTSELNAHFEFIFAHTFAPSPTATVGLTDKGEARFPLSLLGHRRAFIVKGDAE